MRALSWFLSIALLAMLLDIGAEGTRREQPVRTGEAQAQGRVLGLDGNDGQPPPPRP